MEERLMQLESELSEIKTILNQVHGAIVGNPLAKDGGMRKRLEIAEEKLRGLRLRLDVIEKKQIKFNFITMLLWGTAGFVLCGIISYILLLIFKK